MSLALNEYDVGRGSLLTDVEVLHCPYCGEKIELVIDVSVTAQAYIEDCSVCCRPIELSVTIVNGTPVVTARRDDD